MCTASKPPAAPPPVAPPPAPKPVEFGSRNAQTTSKKKNNARGSLSIPLGMGGTSGSSGLGIPS